jgi:hypothetical protein
LAILGRAILSFIGAGRWSARIAVHVRTNIAGKGVNLRASRRARALRLGATIGGAPGIRRATIASWHAESRSANWTRTSSAGPMKVSGMLTIRHKPLAVATTPGRRRRQPMPGSTARHAFRARGLDMGVGVRQIGTFGTFGMFGMFGTVASSAEARTERGQTCEAPSA